MLHLRAQAGGVLEECINVERANRRALFMIGWLRLRQERYDEALVISQQLVRSAEGDLDDVDLFSALYNQSCIRFALSRGNVEVERMALRDLARSREIAQRCGWLEKRLFRARIDRDLQLLRDRFPAEMTALTDG